MPLPGEAWGLGSRHARFGLNGRAPTTTTWILLANCYAFLKKEAEAIRELQIAVALRPNILYNAACTHGILERKADALALLKKAQEVGFPNLDWPARDPDLACLRDDAEFQRLINAGPQKA